MSAELIAERFGVGPIRAQQTLRVTTQRGVRSAILPISRQHQADRVFGVKRLNGKFSTDTAYGKLRSLRSNIACQIYSHKYGFKAAYTPQKVDGNHVGDTLTQFISDYGAPEHLTFDGCLSADWTQDKVRGRDSEIQNQVPRFRPSKTK